MNEDKPEPGIRLTERQLRARRARSIAIAVSLGLLVILFYIVTLVKGPGVLHRPLGAEPYRANDRIEPNHSADPAPRSRNCVPVRRACCRHGGAVIRRG